MKTKIVTFLAFFISAIVIACPLCEKNQPKGFENITHGKGPEGNMDYVIMYSAIIIVGYTLVMSVKYLIKPKEQEENHIKNLVVNENTSS